MSKTILATATAVAVFPIFAAVPVPQVSDGGMRQNSEGVAIINYTLSAAPGIITLDIQTNAVGDVWTSIGGIALFCVLYGFRMWQGRKQKAVA